MLAACKMALSAHQTSITTVAAALSYVTPPLVAGQQNERCEQKRRKLRGAVPSKA